LYSVKYLAGYAEKFVVFGVMATAVEAAKVFSEIRRTGRPYTCTYRHIFCGFKCIITNTATMQKLEVTPDKFYVDKIYRPA
jgi:hypothetical protein